MVRVNAAAALMEARRRWGTAAVAEEVTDWTFGRYCVGHLVSKEPRVAHYHGTGGSWTEALREAEADPCVPIDEPTREGFRCAGSETVEEPPADQAAPWRRLPVTVDGNHPDVHEAVPPRPAASSPRWTASASHARVRVAMASPSIEAVLESIGANVRRLREARGWTQEDLAKAAGVTSRYIKTVETGTANPTVRVMLSLARALGVPHGDFYAAAKLEPRRAPGRPVTGKRPPPLADAPREARSKRQPVEKPKQ